MTWSTALDSLLTQTVSVAGFEGVSTDGYMTAQYATQATTYQARIVDKMTLVRTFEGTEELATTVAWVRSTSTFGPADQVTLPDGSSPVLMAVESFPDETGHHHSKLYLGG